MSMQFGQFMIEMSGKRMEGKKILYDKLVCVCSCKNVSNVLIDLRLEGSNFFREIVSTDLSN